MVDRLDRLYEIVDGYNVRFPDGNHPFAIITRLLEEAGEVASAVNHLEKVGAKVAKHGAPDPVALGYEIEDLIHTALSLARFYGVEHVVDEAINRTHDQLVASGAITPDVADKDIDITQGKE
jgi:NTP pyrophosphatase (non-canonical NTP hydrolase)